MSIQPFFRITEMFGSRDGIRWGYAKASTIAHRRLGACIWSYDVLADRARVYTRYSSDDISTDEIKDEALSELARLAVRARLQSPQWLEAAE